MKLLIGNCNRYIRALIDAEVGGKYALNTPYRTEVCRLDLDPNGGKLRVS